MYYLCLNKIKTSLKNIKFTVVDKKKYYDKLNLW